MMSSSDSLSSGSNESHPASARPNASAAAVTMRLHIRGSVTSRLMSCLVSCLGPVAGKRHEYIHALARPGRRFGIGGDQVEPAFCRSFVAGAPCRECKQLACAV